MQGGVWKNVSSYLGKEKRKNNTNLSWKVEIQGQIDSLACQEHGKQYRKGKEERNKFTFKRDHKSVLSQCLQELQSQGKLIFPIKEGILTQFCAGRGGVDKWRS